LLAGSLTGGKAGPLQRLARAFSPDEALPRSLIGETAHASTGEAWAAGLGSLPVPAKPRTPDGGPEHVTSRQSATLRLFGRTGSAE
jgi:hypothetical protein